jgi:prepilin-type N-terminal cleavage/methylation domain
MRKEATRSAKKPAFTLVEILIVIGIAGIIMASGVAPLLYTVRMLTGEQERFIASNRERAAFQRMAQDIRENVADKVGTSVRILHNDKLENEANDLLIVWTYSEVYAQKPISTVVYGIPQETVLREEMADGLYRWVISSDIKPGDVKIEHLEPEYARMLVPGVTGLKLAALEELDWRDDYTGMTPSAFRATFRYGDDLSIVREEEDEAHTYEAWLPKL